MRERVLSVGPVTGDASGDGNAPPGAVLIQPLGLPGRVEQGDGLPRAEGPVIGVRVSP